jgi:predicted DNA-binding transcriptional regulator AlpA
MVPSSITSPSAPTRPADTPVRSIAAFDVAPDVGDRLLSYREACRVAGGLHRNTLRRLWREHKFPTPVEMSPGRYGWYASEIRAWLAARPRVAA